MLTSRFLQEKRREAMRRGVWFRALDRVERGIMSLAARVVERVESALLGVELVKILGKLRDAMKSGFVRRMEGYGFGRVRELVDQALAWGYEAARGWVSDLGFAMYVTVISMNDPLGFFK